MNQPEPHHIGPLAEFLAECKAYAAAAQPTQPAPQQADDERRALKLYIANLPPNDLAFLKGVVALFTDPQWAEHLRALRRNDALLEYIPGTGLICVHHPARYRNN